MSRSWSIWLILVICAVAILGALGWQTQRTLSMESERLSVNAKAKVEELVRLALSRMDTAASAMLVIENQRPPEYYQPFYQPKVLFTNTLQSVDGKLVTQPSPLLSDPPEFVQLHFEVWAHRDLTSPQVPTGNHRDLAEASGIPAEHIEAATRRLLRLYKMLNQPFTALNGLIEAKGLTRNPDNYDMLCTVAQQGSTIRNETPAHVPHLNEDWSNRQLEEIVNNSYGQAEAQNIYQKDLNTTERFKRQQAYEEVQYRASKVAVIGKSIGFKKSAAAKLRGGVAMDATKEEKSDQTLLVNPQTSIDWSNSSGQVKGQKSTANSKASMPVKRDTDEMDQLVDQQFSQQQIDEESEQKKQEAAQGEALTATAPGSGDIVDIEVTPFRPLWLDEELLVVRRVRSESGMRYQGFWIDSMALRNSLLAGISDLLPNAQLVPITLNDSEGQSASLESSFNRAKSTDDNRSLVTLPWKLEEGIEVDVELAGITPLHTSLGIGWIAVILAMVAAAMLVRGVLRMSERRAAFVSSVTHELRTPLTTFQLYSDLLAEGMVPEGERRQSYLKTMRQEAGRLNHLIENVLSYSRIERGSARAQREKLSVASLVGRFESRLASRASRDKALLEVNGLTDFGSAMVDTDVTATEQIIFNLVDNACKYGLPEEEQPVIRLNVDFDRKWVRLSVCDSGHGIHKGDRRKLFRPFHKSAHDAAETKPGVGLGLALCRRLARALGGDLTINSKLQKGACFVLKLPRVEE